MISIVKEETLFISSEGQNIEEVGGNSSGLSLFCFFKCNGLKMMSISKDQAIGENGFYSGSIFPKKWTIPISFSINPDDKSPSIVMVGDDPELLEPFALWENRGILLAAPTFIKEDILSASVTITDEIAIGGFSFDLNNVDSKYTEEGSALWAMLGDEKSVALFMGFDGELLRMMTAQIDERDAAHSSSEKILSVTAANKYKDLLGITLSKTYGMEYKSSGKVLMREDIHPVVPIKPGDSVEIKLEPIAPWRWYPSSVSILPWEPPAVGIKFSKIYGATETVAYIRIENGTAGDIDPHFDVFGAPTVEDVEQVAESSLVVGDGQSQATKTIEFAKATTVKLSSPLGISNQTETALSFSKPNSDELSAYNSTYPSRLTIPCSGKYQIEIQGKWAPGIGTRVINLRSNGTNVEKSASNEDANGLPTEQKLELTASFNSGDYLEITLFQNSGSTLELTSCEFCLTLIKEVEVDSLQIRITDVTGGPPPPKPPWWPPDHGHGGGGR